MQRTKPPIGTMILSDKVFIVVQTAVAPPPLNLTGFERYSAKILFAPLPPVPLSEEPNKSLLNVNPLSIALANKSLNQSCKAVTASFIILILIPPFSQSNTSAYD